ncbi:short-chain fatty acyl-CoA regulator family protein [Mycobacterium mantenii]|uniref:Cro/Cl family transcriptional regulator n=1 Tax=Mycobacterium mantenii TaxID=560555 RepID=A0A1A2TEC5_MYCNT|nr:short-chain fatty acyl-CoA regulator family protein [Mycobacterium mantenii]OBH43141.1 Cro/Cl family transcriptional regulator [Mycobacterium mantenii]OBH74392.1 Cro/Cl family transcriptional regulator [Mycobacterium mantenii]
MAKTFAGARLRRLREEQGLTQVALARALGLSTSYVNQLENDQRPITVPVLLTLTERFDLPTHYFAPESDARLVSDLREVLADTSVTAAQLEELVARMPAIGQTLVNLHRRLHDTTADLETLHSRANVDAWALSQRPMPFEEVRDFFYDRKNYIGELDVAAEALFNENRLRIGGLDGQLAELLADKLGVTVVIDDGQALNPNSRRLFAPESKTLYVARWLHPGQRAFQLATQIALLTQAGLITGIIAGDDQLSDDARGVARIGLANYFAGALLLPYVRFLDAAESVRYDIDHLARRFEVGFETICHRLSTLQRPNARGVPFIFVRTDSAGNISKRQSATAFHFSRVGGNCPLWVVHHAFSRPGQFLTQVAQMPDERTYFWIARTTTTEPSRYLGPDKSFAIGLGCDVAHAGKLIYSVGIDPTSAESIVPIGAGCKICDRPACAQRAFPYLGQPVYVDPHSSTDLPYPPAITS